MFDVERSSPDRITVNDETFGQRWSFNVVEAADGRSLAADLDDAGSSKPVDVDRLARARTFADIEAWKRGMID